MQATAEAFDNERKRRPAAEKDCADIGIAYDLTEETLTENFDALTASKAEVASMRVCCVDPRSWYTGVLRMFDLIKC